MRAPAFMPAGAGLNAAVDNVTIPSDVMTGANTALNVRGYTQQDKNKGKTRSGETLFGPDLGLEDDGEGWQGKSEVKSKVPLNVVKQWVEKAKKEEQGVHQTTTLQALVNLKRPTLTLIPVSQDEIVPETIPEDSLAAPRPSLDTSLHIRHTLKFTYDASTPLVKISLTVYPRYSNNGKAREVYTTTAPGGFGQVWELPIENAFDIGQAMEDEKRAEEETMLATRKLEGEGSDGSDAEEDHRVKTPTIQPPAPVAVATPEFPNLTNTEGRTMMDRFRRRPRHNDVEEGIIADIRRQQAGEAVEMGPVGPDAVIDRNNAQEQEVEEVKEEEGMRIIIRLDSLTEQGQLLSTINAQATHVLLTGTTLGGPGNVSKTAIATATAEGETSSAVDDREQAPSGIKKVWYIKVVRREAIIGHHTFMLKEIYGLTSQAAPDTSQQESSSSTPNECIVCLTNPRDVVLLPCRHLVVCRECALGMIEFGAGGKVARREESEAVPEPVAEPAEAGPQDVYTGAGLAGGIVNPTAMPPVVPVAPPGRERRKKKAKGWFCPVCRQPYTSLLRLALPSNEENPPAAVDLELSRQPSISRQSMHSLRRVGSRATLPERGERMLEAIANEHDHEHDHDHAHGGEEDATHSTVPPQFVLGEEIPAAGTRPQSRASVRTQERVEAVIPVRTSVEGKQGWKEAV